jgi:hypothetical protein
VSDAQQLAAAVARAWAEPTPRQDRRPADAQVDAMLAQLQAHLN